ncbi:hypothetical protein AW27_026270 [Streptomyces sp. PCS3-D2]|uniref:hypothetical protein n=1 Tax=Streptomyces sp. PCS3-D2 TaxID=1460244 RepID=UPI0004515CE1|nr:hypothetical protein [Streptomyces sp. PCS3-D2]WKV74211.1 hypothetical protein AW27_023505 [Streptomyces sp. PCS3-D2]WKV74713.1 hypothetical protein AW27_026270 [Streptomyces sp. PCS3-D2]
MTPSESQHVATEIAKLRGSVDTGFARVDGALALLVQRSDQTDKQLADHETRLDALERNRWPLATIATLAGVGSLLYTLFGR